MLTRTRETGGASTSDAGFPPLWITQLHEANYDSDDHSDLHSESKHNGRSSRGGSIDDISMAFVQSVIMTGIRVSTPEVGSSRRRSSP